MVPERILHGRASLDTMVHAPGGLPYELQVPVPEDPDLVVATPGHALAENGLHGAAAAAAHPRLDGHAGGQIERRRRGHFDVGPFAVEAQRGARHTGGPARLAGVIGFRSPESSVCRVFGNVRRDAPGRLVEGQR